MSFNFRTSSDISAIKYEGVRLLPNTPRNPNDFHSIQDILRHRMAMQLDELYGNCRVAVGHGDPFVLSDTTVKADGVWYLNGYRIELNDLESTVDFIANEAFNIWLDITFETINLKEDSSIALQDAGTDKFIPTSERFRFKYALRTELTTQAELLPDDVDATYHIGVGTAGVPPDFTDASTIAIIDLKYTTAIEIVQNAISVDPDGWAYIEKMSTGKDEAAAFVESASDGTFLKMGFKDENGEIIALIQALNLGKWFPTFELKREDQRVKISPEGMTIDEGTGNAIEVNPGFINLSSSAAQQFQVDEVGIRYHYPMIHEGKRGFEAVLLAKNITEAFNSVTEIEGDTAPSTAFYQKANYIRSQPVDPEVGTAIYYAVFSDDIYPKDGMIWLEHLIKVAQGQGTSGTVVLNVKFFDSTTSIEPDAEDFSTIKTYTWDINAAMNLHKVRLKFHPHPGGVIGGGGDPTGPEGEGGDEFIPPNGGGDPWYAHFRFEYTIISEENIIGTVEWLNGQNLTNNVYTNPFILTGVDYLRIKNYFFFVDGAGNLRIKYMGSVHNGTVIQAINEPPGTEPTAPGGMIVGGGLKTLTGGASAPSVTGDVTILTGVSAGLAGPFVYTDVEHNAIQIKFPAIDETTSADYGLVSRAGWDGMADSIIQGGSGVQSFNNKTDPNQKLGVTKVAGAQGLPIWKYDAGATRHNLQFPNPDIGGEGLFSNAHFLALQSALHNQPQDIKFVALEWIHPVTGDPLSNSDPFYTEIQIAINAAVKGDTIMVYPGEYDGFVLKDGVNVIAYDVPSTIVTTPIYDRNLSDDNHNISGVKCEVAITIDTSSVSANITALYVDRAGTVLNTRGTIISKAIGSSIDGLTEPYPTVDIRAGKWIHNGDVGIRVSSTKCMGGGVDVNGTNGTAMVEIYGNIYISQHLDAGSFLEHNVNGLDVGTKGGNSANALMVGDIYAYEGCFALLRTGSTLGYINYRGNLTLGNSWGHCVDVSGIIHLADGKIANNGNIDSPILFRNPTSLRLRSIEILVQNGGTYGIESEGAGTDKYVTAMPVYSNKMIDTDFSDLFEGDYTIVS